MQPGKPSCAWVNLCARHAGRVVARCLGVSEPCSMVVWSQQASIDLKAASCAHGSAASAASCAAIRARMRPRQSRLPTAVRLRCRAPITRTCAFIKALPKTLAFHWDARKTRGFGNFWPYLRTFQYSAPQQQQFWAAACFWLTRTTCCRLITWRLRLVEASAR